MATLEIDHVIVAVADLEGAAAGLAATAGLAAVAGGRHPGHGTGNMIVPLGATYLELMAVVDRDEAEGSMLGRFVMGHVADGGGPMAVCLRTDDIEAIASARGLEAMAMGRTRPDGSGLTWHLAGLERALGAERLPFFIEWHIAPDDHPGRSPVEHPAGIASLDRVVVGGEAGVLSRWLGGAALPIEVVGGPPGLVAAHLSVGGAHHAIAGRL